MTQGASSTTKRESSRSRCSRTSAFCSATLCVSRSGVTSSTLVASGRAYRVHGGRVLHRVKALEVTTHWPYLHGRVDARRQHVLAVHSDRAHCALVLDHDLQVDWTARDRVSTIPPLQEQKGDELVDQRVLSSHVVLPVVLVLLFMATMLLLVLLCCSARRSATYFAAFGHC